MLTQKPKKVTNILSESERQILLEYFYKDDDKTDSRPDVRSKHPDWDNDVDWPKDIIKNCLIKLFSKNIVVEDISFREDKIGLKPHTDFGSVPGTLGKTVLILLDFIPCAQTVFFDNYWPENDKLGAFFTKNWNPYTYKLEDKDGNLIEIEDLRIF